MIPIEWYLILSAVLFLIGVLGFFIKRNIIALLLSGEERRRSLVRSRMCRQLDARADWARRPPAYELMSIRKARITKNHSKPVTWWPDPHSQNAV